MAHSRLLTFCYYPGSPCKVAPPIPYSLERLPVAHDECAPAVAKPNAVPKLLKLL